MKLPHRRLWTRKEVETFNRTGPPVEMAFPTSEQEAEAEDWAAAQAARRRNEDSVGRLMADLERLAVPGEDYVRAFEQAEWRRREDPLGTQLRSAPLVEPDSDEIEAVADEQERLRSEAAALDLERRARSPEAADQRMSPVYSRPPIALPEDWTIEVTATAKKEIHRLPRDQRERIEAAFESLQGGNADLCQIKGSPGHFRLRVGERRALLKIVPREKVIRVLRVRSRGSVYEP